MTGSNIRQKNETHLIIDVDKKINGWKSPSLTRVATVRRRVVQITRADCRSLRGLPLELRATDFYFLMFFVDNIIAHFGVKTFKYKWASFK